jgi:hypothetical protein
MKLFQKLSMVLVTAVLGVSSLYSSAQAHIGVHSRQTCFLKDVETGEWRGGDRNYWIEQDPYMNVTFWTLDMKQAFPFPKMKFALERVMSTPHLLIGSGFFRGESFEITVDRTGDQSRVILTYADRNETYDCEKEPEDTRP